MFRIAEILIDDKKLSEFLKRCAGLVHQMEFPQPVENAEIDANGAVKEITSGKIEDAFNSHIRRNHWKTLTAESVRGYLSSVGKSPGSASYVLQNLKKRGLIKNGQKRGTYTVTAKK